MSGLHRDMNYKCIHQPWPYECQKGLCPAAGLPRECSVKAVQPDILSTPHSVQSPAAGQHPGAM